MNEESAFTIKIANSGVQELLKILVLLKQERLNVVSIPVLMKVHTLVL